MFISTASKWALAMAALTLAAFARTQVNNGSQWPTVRGNLGRTGQSSGYGATPQSKWSVFVDDITSTAPVIGDDGTLYVSSIDGYIAAIEPATGAIKWTFGEVAPGQPPNYYGNLALGPNGLLFAVTLDVSPQVIALDAVSGTEKWAVNESFTELGYGPSVGGDGTVYIGSEQGLLALDGSTGDQKWLFAIPDWGAEAPAIGPDGSICFITYFGNLYDLDGKTGAEKWCAYVGGVEFQGVAIGPDGTVFCCTDDITQQGLGAISALDGQTGVVRWSHAVGNYLSDPAVGANGRVYAAIDYSLQAFDAASGNRVAEFQTANFFWPPILGADGTVYDYCGNGNLYAFDPETLTKSWMISSASRGFSIAADGTLYHLTVDGYLHALTADETNSVAGISVPTRTPLSGSLSGLVQLSKTAGKDGVAVELTTDSAEVTVPPLIQVPAGANAVSFPISRNGLKQSESVMFTARLGSSVQQAAFTISEEPIAGFYTSPIDMIGGTSTHGVVQIPSPAPTGGETISLASDVAYVQLPTSVTIPAGKTGVSFVITTSAVQETSDVNLFAVTEGLTKTTSIVIRPNKISNFYTAESTVVEGMGTRGVVQIAVPAGPNGLTISLACSNTYYAQLPASVTIPPGKTGVSFPITTVNQNFPYSVVLYAYVPGNSLQTLLALRPPSWSP